MGNRDLIKKLCFVGEKTMQLYSKKNLETDYGEEKLTVIVGDTVTV